MAAWGLGVPLRGGLLALAVGLALLMHSGGAPEASSWTCSWASGMPLEQVLLPALASSLTRWVPVWVGVVGISHTLALAEGRAGQWARGMVLASSGIPVFLAGYLVIVGVNRAVWLGIEHGMLSPPAWFALPVGDGDWHLLRWGLELGVLAIGDGCLASCVARLHAAVVRLREAPFVLASRLNADSGEYVLRRHLRGPLGIEALLLLPALAGASLVLEPLFLEPGVGLLLIRSLEARDLPVLASLLALGVVLGALVQLGLSMWSRHALADGGNPDGAVGPPLKPLGAEGQEEPA